MSKFIQDGSGLVVSVADSKDDRFAVGFKPFSEDAVEDESQPDVDPADEPSEEVPPAADLKRGPGRPKKAEEKDAGE